MKSNLFKQLIMLVISVFFIQQVYCQKDFLPGYIIKVNGDTLHGFIDYRNWESNPNKITFKSTLIEDKSVYTPKEIKEFMVNDEIYVSGNIKFETSSHNIKDLTRSPKFTLENDTTFLQTLIKGEKSLYLYKNKFYGKEQFYIKKDSSFEFLMYKKYLDINYFILENKKYINQLSLYFKDCPRIYSTVANTEYRINSLENLFNAYYNYTHSEIKFQKKKEKISLETGLFVGVSQTTLSFSSKLYSYIENAHYNQSTNLATGIFVGIVLPRNQRRFSIYNELMYSSYKIKGTYSGISNGFTENYNSTFAYSYIKMNNMFRFKIPVKTSYFFLNAGFSNGYAFSETNYLKKERILYYSTPVEEGKAIEDSKKYELGYLAGLGVIYKNKYSLELRFELGNGMSTYGYVTSNVYRSFLLFAYKI